MPRVVLPALVRVMVWAGGGQLRPHVQEKTRPVGTSFTSVPVPLSETVWGLPGTLSETDRLAERVLMALGVNVTLIVQLAPVATELPQVLVWAKFARIGACEADAGDIERRGAVVA